MCDVFGNDVLFSPILTLTTIFKKKSKLLIVSQYCARLKFITFTQCGGYNTLHTGDNSFDHGLFIVYITVTVTTFSNTLDLI